MKSITCMGLLLCSLCGVCVSGLEWSTVEVQPGQKVTLLCFNFTNSLNSIQWFHIKRSTFRILCTISEGSKPAKLCDEDRRFTVKSNLSHIFLTIDPVKTSDSGLYFCGYLISSDPVIKSPTYLVVQEVDQKVLVYILGGLVVLLLVVVIGLAVKNKMLKNAQNQQQPAPTIECSDNLNYASVNFRQKSRTSPLNVHQESATYAAVKRMEQPELL